MRVRYLIRGSALARVSKDVARLVASWFETALVRLLTMRVSTQLTAIAEIIDCCHFHPCH